MGAVVLTSPEFLARIEPDGDDAGATSPEQKSNDVDYWLNRFRGGENDASEP
jgi:hypothetical protein